MNSQHFPGVVQPSGRGCQLGWQDQLGGLAIAYVGEGYQLLESHIFLGDIGGADSVNGVSLGLRDNADGFRLTGGNFDLGFFFCLGRQDLGLFFSFCSGDGRLLLPLCQ